MDTTAALATHIAFMSSVIWAVVQYGLKPTIGKVVDTGLLVLITAALVGIAYTMLPQAQGALDTLGELLLAALGASTLHNVAVGSGNNS